MDAEIMAKGAIKREVDRPKSATEYAMLQIRMPLDLIGLIDDWRRAQDDLPVRTEAARRLIVLALKAAKARHA
jgi:hypothetical protein